MLFLNDNIRNSGTNKNTVLSICRDEYALKREMHKKQKEYENMSRSNNKVSDLNIKKMGMNTFYDGLIISYAVDSKEFVEKILFSLVDFNNITWISYNLFTMVGFHHSEESDTFYKEIYDKAMRVTVKTNELEGVKF